jgi:hypothetical protein
MSGPDGASEAEASGRRGPPTPESAAPQSPTPQSPAPEPSTSPRGFAPDRRFLLILVALALLTRLVWVLWLHPPGDYVFSDMQKYVERAQDLAEHGFHPDRTLAWQAWGTHHLLALPLWIFGTDALWAGAVMWGLMGAAAVPAGYLLSCRVSTRAWMPKVVGIALLAWHPSLSNSGYFLSEAPFLCFMLWSTLGLVVVLQEGRCALLAGLASAVAFAVRPQSALFFVLVLLTWLVCRKRLPHVRVRQLVLVAVPLLAMLGYSSWRFHAHTGQWLGVAENANMNLTAGRCHNIVTQAFKNEGELRRSEAANNTRDGRRVSLPGYRVLAKRLPPEHPLALRPAMESETIRFVGYIGDPEIHEEIRRECYARTGVLEQIRYGVVNMSLLWFVGQQWPELEQKTMRTAFVTPIILFKHFFQIAVWLPSIIGIGIAIARIRSSPALSFCAWQLVTSMTIAAIFFGDIRLRTPYDPYAIILALETWAIVVPWLRARLIARRSSPS